MEKGLVSIISPCYNGEKYIRRYLESILKQTYEKIELIIIDDGSEDNTKKIILEYKIKFEERGINLIYVFQENAGQAEAINKGLQLFKGEYLTWPDSDDTLEPESIKRKVEFLNENPQYGFVRTPANIIDDKTNKIIGYLKPKNKKIKEELFEDFIFENDIWFAPGCYMVRTEAFLNVLPERKIYPSRSGQNWQMFLPISFDYRCGYISEYLYNYYVRENSHSHDKNNDLQAQLLKLEGYKDILITVLSQMNLLEKYKERLNIKYSKKRFNLAYRFKEKELLKEEYSFLKNKHKLDIKTIIKYIIIMI